MDIWPIAKGLATWVPFLYEAERGTTGGTISSRYCYSVWLRHWVLTRTAGLVPDLRVVAELGPGDSLGIGIAALLSGASDLRAFDVVRYATNETNLRILGELADLFRSRADIPDDGEFPGVFPRLSSYRFPAHLWKDAGEMARNLDPARVASIADALAGRPSPIRVSYRVPWEAVEPAERGSVDFVYSQAVLEHVADLDAAYSALGAWVREGGAVSHTIDFGSHCITAGWDGHRQYSDAVWRLVCGARPYLLNRVPPQGHLDGLRSRGFEVLAVLRDQRMPTLPQHQLAPRFQGMVAADRETRSMHVIARRLPVNVSPGPTQG